MRNIRLAIALSAVLLATGCSNMSKTQERALVGAGVGAAIGGGFGLLPGGVSVGTGALIGAGVGAVGGVVYDQFKKANTPTTK